jgi:hypothetical protein
MADLSVNESRMLYFHRILLEEAAHTPGLLTRAREVLAAMRARRPQSEDVWAEWSALLDGEAGPRAQAVLADTPKGGLLRANSPIAEGLSQEERNALWQRMGLHQFVYLYIQAAKDLALTPAEESAMVGLPAEELAEWRASPPVTVTGELLEALKVVVAVHRALERIFPDVDARRAWLRKPVDLFAARPVDLIASGHGAALRDYLTEALQPLIGDHDRPSH